MDGPGHYFRRIKSVAVSIPCVDRPVRQRQLHADAAEEQHPQDAAARRRRLRARGRRGRPLQRLLRQPAVDRHQLGAERQRPVRDQPARRALPAVRERRARSASGSSSCRPIPPGEPRQFDYDTISDVILHLRYTAREGGGLLRADGDRERCDDGDRRGAGGRLGAAVLGAARVPDRVGAVRRGTRRRRRRRSTITLREEHYPFWARHQSAGFGLHGIELFASPGADPLKVNGPGADQQSELKPIRAWVTCAGWTWSNPSPDEVGQFTVHLSDNSISDLWLALTWGAPLS